MVQMCAWHLASAHLAALLAVAAPQVRLRCRTVEAGHGAVVLLHIFPEELLAISLPRHVDRCCRIYLNCTGDAAFHNASEVRPSTT